MSDLSKRIAELSPQKRELLIQQLNNKRQNVAQNQIQCQSRDSHSFPLSFAQQRLWFLDQLEPGNSSYNIPAIVRVEGQLNAIALEQSLNAIIQRHEILRTCFAIVDEQSVQIIVPELKLTLPVIDLRQLSETEREQTVQRLTTQEAQQSFDLRQAPLLRVSLLHLSESDYVVLFTMHHIISDGWSMGILIQEIATFYSKISSNQPLLIPELPIQYADFAVWQRQWLAKEVLEDQINYWKKQLGGSLPILDLPTDRPRPAVQTFKGGQQTFVLPKKLGEQLMQLGKQQEATLFMVLLAAFKTLLYRYTGQEDILVGSPIANRNRAEIEGLIGFFVNTLVLRTHLDDTLTFRQLLKQVRNVALGAYAHQDLPFEKLIEELQPERNLSHTPLFQVMFAFQNEPTRQTLEIPGLILHSLDADTGTAKFDLTLTMVDTQEGLTGTLEYKTDLFEAATISRMIGHFQTLLKGIVTHPEQQIASLPLLTKLEQHQLLIEWNDTQIEDEQNWCVHELFEQQMEKTPDAVAVVFENEQLTYRQLNQQANQLAHYLQKLGVKPEVPVGICVKRSIIMLIGLLGILKAGGAYVPLDPAYPKERLAFMLEDVQAPVLLTQQHLVEELPYHKTQVVCLDDDWQEIAQESTENSINQAIADNLAYIIYTSGSTGKPKGTLILHRGLVNYLSWCSQAYKVEQGQGALVHSSITFDMTITGLFSPLLVGSKVELLPEDKSIETLAVALRNKSNFSLVKITPAHLELLNHQLSPQEAAGRTRAFIIGGENLVAETISFWQKFAPDTLLVNEYGPTETVVGCCVYFVPKNQLQSGSILIGRPIANTQLYILNQQFQPVPIGVVGELYIGGDGVARGYLNRPELTAERFILNPFSDKPGARLYKTGDLARYRTNGNIEFLGRIDHQVKIRGFRIELGEIEAMLNQHPAVQAAVVLVREDEPGRKRLVAYVNPYPEQTLTVSELRSGLQEKLPDYMVPSTYVFLKSLPLTPNGKVDRRALPKPDSTTPEKNLVAPRTPIEKILAEIWAKVLGVQSVGVNDNFFELGGDSIISLQVIFKTNQAGLQLTPKHLFQYQTIAELATVAGTSQSKLAEQGIVSGTVALTPIQHWFFEQNFLDPHHWNQSVLLEVRQTLNSFLLKQAVQHLILHHDALRMRFIPEGNDHIQQINTSPEESISFTQIDLSYLPETEQISALEATANQLQASLNLSSGSLVQVALFDLGQHQHSRLLIVIHHLVIDGVSWRILLEDLHSVYEQLLQGVTKVQLPPKSTSFQQWAQLLVEYANSAQLQSELNYWLLQLQKPIVSLPVDDPRGDNTIASSCTVSASLTPEETQALLQEVPTAYQTQINDVLLTALAQTFAEWTGVTSLLVDLEGHGREVLFDEVDLSRTVGWFTSIFPVLLDIQQANSPIEALKIVKEQLRRLPNRGISYGILRYLSSDETAEKLANLPQAEVVFNYLGRFDQTMSELSLFAPAGESAGANYSKRGEQSHLIAVNGLIIEGQLQLNWTYSKAVHSSSTIESLAQKMILKLRSLIAYCQFPDLGGYTPSDFPDVELSQVQLDKALAEIDFG